MINGLIQFIQAILESVINLVNSLLAVGNTFVALSLF